MRNRRLAAVAMAVLWLVFLWSSTLYAGGRYHGRHWGGKHRYGNWGHHGWHHHGHRYDYWAGALAVGLGVGLLSALVFSPPAVVYARPAPQRTLVCEPQTFTVHRRVDPRTGRFYWVQEPNPQRCWYEYWR
jgi:hypothetical protein